MTGVRILLVMALALAGAGAQENPIHWSFDGAPAKAVKPGSGFGVRVVARIDEGWHMYSISQPPGGPIPTRISLAAGQRFTLSGPIKAPAPMKTMDKNFDMEVEWYEGSAEFTLPIKLAADAPAGRQKLLVSTYYQVCNDQLCLPPKTVKLELAVDVE